jgi:hypothetical protein
VSDRTKRAVQIAAQNLEGSVAAGQWLAEPEELAAATIAAFLDNISGAVIATHPGEGVFEALAASVRRISKEEANGR